MTRSSRMFEIIQHLRSAEKPLTAMQLAEELEVTSRTIYRDIATLQSMRVPIDGAAGVGYIMRPGFDLPPLNFDVEEAEAITLGLAMVARSGDTALHKSAQRAATKIADATPLSQTLFSSTWGADTPKNIDLPALRQAIRENQKLSITYVDVTGKSTKRIILPIAIIYYSEAIVLPGWCELRQDFRHFRVDRIKGQPQIHGSFADQAAVLRQRWAKEHVADL